MAGIRRCGLLLALVVQAGAVASAESPNRLRYAVRLDDLQVLRQRLELEAGGVRLVALDARRGLDPVYQAFGLETPWLVLGPVEPGGLLRELANPLGFTPGSGVFGERSGLRLESSLSGTSRRGLQLAPLPERLGLYAVRSRTVPFTFGGLLRLPLGRAGEAEALAQLVLPPQPAAAEAWFAGEPAHLGGPLVHLAGRFALQSSANPRQPAGPILSWGAALCAGPMARPGLYNRITAGLETGPAAAEALLGFCTEEYRTPEGTGGDSGTRLGLRVRVGAPTGTRLQFEWNRRDGQPACGPAAVSAAYLPGCERWSLRLQIEAERARLERVRFEAAGEVGTEWGSIGVSRPDAGGALELSLESPKRQVVLGIRGAWKEEGGGNRVRGYASCSRESLSLEGGLEVDPASPREAELSAALRLMGRGQNFSLTARGPPARPPEVGLSWSVAQALPKSPTSRISRARRQP
jgi:hypothetical protein